MPDGTQFYRPESSGSASVDAVVPRSAARIHPTASCRPSSDRSSVTGHRSDSRPSVRPVALAAQPLDPEYTSSGVAVGRRPGGAEAVNRGLIVAGFFDVGVASRFSWSDRPQASALLVASGDPDRCFDAAIVGDYERVFGTAAEFRELVLLFESRGVQVWMPEAGGLVSADDADFPALLTVLQSVVYSSAVRAVRAGRRRLGGQVGRRALP